METTVSQICPTRTQERIKAGAILVDVREVDETAQLAYDVPNLIQIPLSQLESRYSELPMDRELILACKSGGRSLKATLFLLKKGYHNVTNMQYGMNRWVEKGFPTKGDIKSAATASGSCC